MSNLMKIHPVRAEMFHAGGQRDIRKLTDALAILRTRLKMQENAQLYFETLSDMVHSK